LTKLRRWRKIGNDLKLEAYCLYLAAKDPRTPWYAKALVVCVVGYALCPLDFIPDFIPILGYLDDLIIIPAGMSLAIRLVPHEVLDDCRKRAPLTLPTAVRAVFVVTAAVIFLWVIFALIAILLIRRLL
jgi:uncharacterized membrane protein YkvA (DUF1232 family)